VGSGSKPVAWITGAGGLIGNELVRSAPSYAPSFTVVGVTKSDCNLLDFSKVDTLLDQHQPKLIIHCAAISRSTDSQGAPDLAKRVNVDATRHLVELGGDIPFVFFSTDLVFDGTKGNYVETDCVNPLSTYAETKVAAEETVRRNPRHCIVRLSLTGGHSPKGDRGFNEEIKNGWREGRTLNLFIDEFRCPAAAPVIARAVWELAMKNAVGTFHLCGSEKLSRLQIGQLLAAKHPELNPRIVAGSRKDYSGPPRPADTSMDCSKTQSLLSFRLPGLSDWLKEDQSGF
jgi:dTDP-4-dehydrorhamnose reductase